MTPVELERWGRDYRRKLDHKITLDRIRREGAEWIRDHRAKWADLRRREEALSFKLLHDRVQRASREAAVGRKPFPLDLAQRWNAIHAEATGTTPANEVALLPLWRRHADDIARELRAEVSWVRTNGVNAYAVPTARRIECAPITSAFGYAGFLHEAGHCAHPCAPAHRRVTSDKELKKTVCPACELIAWRWAIAHARPTWTAPMHRCLALSLPSYRRYGTQAEQHEIDELTSGIGFRRAQLARLKGRTV
jgi:hypothetical protein